MSTNFTLNGCLEWGGATAIPLSSNLSVAAWVKFAAATATEDVVFVVTYDGVTDSRMVMNRNSGQVFCVLDDPAGYQFIGCNTPVTGVWNHYAVVFNGALLQVYINGAAAFSVAATTSVGIATLASIRWGYPATSQAKETISDGVVYSKALTAPQVAALYAFRKPTDVASLQGWYILDSSPLVDSSGSGRTLVSVGTAVAAGSDDPPAPWDASGGGGVPAFNRRSPAQRRPGR